MAGGTNGAHGILSVFSWRMDSEFSPGRVAVATVYSALLMSRFCVKEHALLYERMELSFLCPVIYIIWRNSKPASFMWCMLVNSNNGRCRFLCILSFQRCLTWTSRVDILLLVCMWTNIVPIMGKPTHPYFSD